ncbi:DUF1972 domain-containing protein [Flavobacteriaceae bacterium]|nr:DUF1972 domain-containing protein [Flavobacteriaceae bacterium]
MKIAILGTRGIPNYHGGFEQYAEYLSVGLHKLGHSVTVYNSSEHPFNEKFFKGVRLIKIYCPETKYGAFSHFIYDWLCSKDATVSDQFDIIYHLGYQSSSPAIFWFKNKSKSIWITNMDGLEWKRDKWSKPVKLLTKIMEQIAIRVSDYLISDNIGIQSYYKKIFNVNSKYLAYGANIPKHVNKELISEYNVIYDNYYILVARLEPENSVEIILDGFLKSKSSKPFLVVGKFNTKYGSLLKLKYKNNLNIRFTGGVYEKNKLDALRKYSSIYFHGHTVGGTNPSLLEAMALGCFISHHNNNFNKSVIKNNTFSFKNYFDVSRIINNYEKNVIKDINSFKNKNISIIKNEYSWKKIINEHDQFFQIFN